MAEQKSPHVTFKDWEKVLFKGRNNPLRIIRDTKRNIDAVGRKHGEPHAKKKGIVWSVKKGKWVKDIDLDRSVQFEGDRIQPKAVFQDGRWVIPERQRTIGRGLNIKGIQKYSKKDEDFGYQSSTTSPLDQYTKKDTRSSYEVMQELYPPGSSNRSNLGISKDFTTPSAARGLQSWYRGGPRTLKQARDDTDAYFRTSGWGEALKGVSQRDRNEIGKAFRGGYATVFTNKGGKDFLHYKGRVYSKPTQGG